LRTFWIQIKFYGFDSWNILILRRIFFYFHEYPQLLEDESNVPITLFLSSVIRTPEQRPLVGTLIISVYYPQNWAFHKLFRANFSQIGGKFTNDSSTLHGPNQMQSLCKNIKFLLFEIFLPGGWKWYFKKNPFEIWRMTIQQLGGIVIQIT